MAATLSDSVLTHFNVPSADIGSVHFRPNGEDLLILSRTSGLLQYSIMRKVRPFSFQASNFTPSAASYNTDGNKIYGASFQGQICAWIQFKSQPIAQKNGHPVPISDLKYISATDQIVTSSNDKTIKIWSSNLEFLRSISGDFQFTCLAISPIDNNILSGDLNGNIIFWDPSKKRPQTTKLTDQLDPKPKVWEKSFRLKGHNSIRSISYDHTGMLICVSTQDGHLSIWDNTGSKIIQMHKIPPSLVLFHPKNPMILTASETNSIPSIIDLTLATQLYTFEAHQKPLCGAAWSPNGKLFATADRDGVVIVWKMPKNKVIPSFVTKTGEPYTPPTE